MPLISKLLYLVPVLRAIINDANPGIALPNDIKEVPLTRWDKGVFDYEIRQLQHINPDRSKTTYSTTKIEEGSYAGTQLALTEVFHRIEKGYTTWFNVKGLELPIPKPLSLERKREAYKYQPPTKDGYPPHVDVIPSKDQKSLFEIFDKLGLIEAQTIMPKIVPNTIVSTVSAGIIERFQDWVFGDPEKGITIADIERQNKLYRKSGTDVMRGANIGDYANWYTDAVFAQQYLTGTDPVSLCPVSERLLIEFRSSAYDQGRKDVLALLANTNSSSLYMVDGSYYRSAMGMGPRDQIVKKEDGEDLDLPRYGCASVTLFRLQDDGDLHPLAIVLDYKGTMGDSVVIFNDHTSHSQTAYNESWPWRYAKTLVQSSNWTNHELAIHLTYTHMVEEAIIVATHRNIPADNIVYQLLEPHWFRTLSLNAAARETLVPSIILAVTGLNMEQGINFIQHSYRNFDFQARYIPRDLKARGFPVEELGSRRFRNCTYARNISIMWQTLRKFVSSMIKLYYKCDDQVKSDKYIQDWCKEIQSPTGAQMPSFPTILSVEELIDAVTMCIHVASPQHTAVNYLQSFCQTFVINKPPAMFLPIPTTLSELQAVDEAFLVKSLPIGHQRQWLLASHIAWLLSFRPAEENNLINYAASLWNLYKRKGDDVHGPQIAEKARTFYEDLRNLIPVFEKHSKEMGKTQQQFPYRVLDPRENAVSILI